MQESVLPVADPAAPRVAARGRNFDRGQVMALHSHDRPQLIYANGGVITVGTEHGHWVVPPGKAVWIPAGVQHQLRTISRADTISIWIDASENPDLPDACRVLEITPLVHHLLHEIEKL